MPKLKYNSGIKAEKLQYHVPSLTGIKKKKRSRVTQSISHWLHALLHKTSQSFVD